jgi:hypothetical protein
MKRVLVVAGAAAASVVLLFLGNLLLLGQAEPPVVVLMPVVDPYSFYLGLLLWVFYAAVLLIALRLAITLRREAAIPPAVLANLRDAARRGAGAEARDLCRMNESFLARVMTAGLARLPLGPEAAREAAYQMTLTVKAEKERQLAYLEMLAVLGATIGLLAFCHAVRHLF